MATDPVKARGVGPEVTTILNISAVYSELEMTQSSIKYCREAISLLINVKERKERQRQPRSKQRIRQSVRDGPSANYIGLLSVAYYSLGCSLQKSGALREALAAFDKGTRAARQARDQNMFKLSDKRKTTLRRMLTWKMRNQRALGAD